MNTVLTMGRVLASCVVLGGALWAVQAGFSQAKADPQVSVRDMAPRDWHVEELSSDLSYPWNIERSGNRFILTEAAGNIVTIEGDRLTRTNLQTSVPVAHEGGGGLLGMALAADFERSGTAYLYHTYRIGNALANRVIRAQFDGQSWREEAVLLDDIPGHRLYNGGRLVIGPDQHLYVTTGWTENRALPRDRNSLAGKVLRMGLDGSVPSDNPFSGSYVYSIGHRNPQGLAWSPSGDLYVAEHGQIGNDEINRVVAAGDYGWPVVEGNASEDGTNAPVLHSGRSTWAPAGVAFAGDELLMTALRERSLYRYDPAANTLNLLYRAEDRLRDVLVAEDGIYLITTNRSPRSSGVSSGDRLLRLSPSSDAPRGS